MTVQIGDKIKKAIRGKGFTMDEAAEKLGISRGTLFYKLKGADSDKAFVQSIKDSLDIDLTSDTAVSPSDLINYNIPIGKQRIAVITLPLNAGAKDIDKIISHLKLMKEAME